MPTGSKPNKSNCLICDATDFKVIIDFGSVNKTSQSYFESSHIELKQGELIISICSNCGHIQNVGYEESKESQYNEQYLSSSSYSDISKAHYKTTIEKLLKKCSLSKNSKVIEIGCGDGYFLSLLANQHIDCYGYEPSGIFNFIADNNHMTLYNLFYDNKSDNNQYDLFILRHVLEHLANPLETLKDIKSKYLFFEVPSAEYLIENKMYSDFYYDHISYFTKRSVICFLNKINYELVDMSISSLTEFHGVLAKKKTSNIKDNKLLPDIISPKLLHNFSQSFASFKKRLRAIVQDYNANGKSITVWGAGARGITTLMHLNIPREMIDYIIDSDERKIGKYIPSFSAEIKSPDIFYKQPTDVLIITSATYSKEIIATIKENIKVESELPDLITLYPSLTICTNK